MRRFLARLIVSAVVAYVALPMGDAGARDYGARIGSWALFDLIRTGDSTGPAYALTVELVEGDDRSPIFSLRCEGGQFGFQLSGRVGSPQNDGERATEVRISIDGQPPIQIAATTMSIGRSAISEGRATPELIAAIARAQRRLNITDPAMRMTFMFDVRRSEKAVRAFRIACDVPER